MKTNWEATTFDTLYTVKDCSMPITLPLVTQLDQLSTLMWNIQMIIYGVTYEG